MTTNSSSAAPKMSKTTHQDMSLLHEYAFVAIICSGQLMTQAALGQVISTLYIVGDSFGTRNAGQLSWFAAAYSLTVGTFILIAGRLGDMYGHKRIFVAGFVWFGLWSLIAGLSVYSSQILFDVARALQGIGPACVLPNALAILGHVYPAGKRKDMVFSIFGATAPNGFLVGALFSAIFGQLLWWPWAYWSMAIACIAIALLAIVFIPTITKENPDDGVQQHFDFAGSAAGVAGLVLVNIAWNQAPVVGWGTPYVYILFIIGVLFLGVFGYIEMHISQPLIPRGVFAGETGFVLACMGAGWSCFGIWIFYLWKLVEPMRGSTPLSAVAQFVPAGISGLVAALTTGTIMGRMRSSYIMVIAMVAFAVGMVLLGTAPVEQTYWAQTFPSMIIMPWGMDMSFPASTIILSNSLSKQNQGIAASLITTVVNYSISIGLGIAGTVESQIGREGQDVLRGYRGATYTGIGLSVLGVAVSTVFVIMGDRKRVVNNLSR